MAEGRGSNAREQAAARGQAAKGLTTARVRAAGRKQAVVKEKEKNETGEGEGEGVNRGNESIRDIVNRI